MGFHIVLQRLLNTREAGPVKKLGSLPGLVLEALHAGVN